MPLKLCTQRRKERILWCCRETSEFCHLSLITILIVGLVGVGLFVTIGCLIWGIVNKNNGVKNEDNWQLLLSLMVIFIPVGYVILMSTLYLIEKFPQLQDYKEQVSIMVFSVILFIIGLPFLIVGINKGRDEDGEITDVSLVGITLLSCSGAIFLCLCVPELYKRVKKPFDNFVESVEQNRGNYDDENDNVPCANNTTVAPKPVTENLKLENV